jgi:hypothetical protein
MRNRNPRAICRRASGISSIEFAFAMLVLVPLFLGTGATGINMVRTLQTEQLARDIGHMYARGLDFSLPGNRTVISKLGDNLGLSLTAGQGNAVVILSSLIYVDKAQCAAVGAVDAGGNPTAACTNYQKWVFTQRLTVGKSALRASNYGTPAVALLDPTTGKITQANYVKNAGALATLSGFNPYSNANNIVQGIPSGQMLYLAESSAIGFTMPPFVNTAATYSYGFF